jgi:Spy/CpxP family protein refolding chaperone
MDIIIPDSFMVTEEAIQEAPVIICDVAPIDIAEATALASPVSSGEVETGIKKSAPTFTVRPPLRRRRKGGRRDAVQASPVSKVVLKVKPFAFAPPKSDDAQPPSGNRIGGGGGSSRKRKLYELGPLDNPDAERCRLNALNAKKNREKKKRQLAEAAQEIDRLRSENSVLRTEADEVRDQLEQARRELARLRAQIKANGVLTPPGGTSLGNGNLQQAKRIV